MPGDIGPYQAQWNLRPRIEALRTEAKELHKQTADTFAERTTDIGVARDRAARDQYAAEQSAKSADIQVGVERKAVANADEEIAIRERQIADLDKRGDRAGAEELREDVGKFASDRTAHAARARQAELDAAGLREDAAGHQRRVTELNVERQDVVDQAGLAERNIDKMDDQVRLLEQARLKYAEADMATDVGTRATLELEAEALVTSAGAIQVDRDLIRAVVPELPDETPGIDADPGPLPAGFDDEISSADPSSDPSADDGTAVAAGDESSGADTDDDPSFAASGDLDGGNEGGSDTVTAGGGDALGIESFTDTATGQGFESGAFDESFEQAPADSGESGFDTNIEPAASFDAGDATTDFGAETFEAPAETPDAFADDTFAGGEADQFATDFATPEFASTESFETESFEAETFDA